MMATLRRSGLATDASVELGLERLGSSTDIPPVYRRWRDSRVTTELFLQILQNCEFRLAGEVDGGLGGDADPDEDGHPALAVLRVVEADLVLADRKRQLRYGRVADLPAVHPDPGGGRGREVEDALRQLHGH